MSELAGTLDIARPTAEKYLELLERSYVIFRVGALSTNLRNKIGKKSKIFFWDTGVRNALLKEFSLSPLRSDIGSLFENWVMAEVVKQHLANGNKLDIHFWRKKDGSEVDLVLRGTNLLKAYEIKWSKQNATRGSKSLRTPTVYRSRSLPKITYSICLFRVRLGVKKSQFAVLVAAVKITCPSICLFAIFCNAYPLREYRWVWHRKYVCRHL